MTHELDVLLLLKAYLFQGPKLQSLPMKPRFQIFTPHLPGLQLSADRGVLLLQQGQAFSQRAQPFLRLFLYEILYSLLSKPRVLQLLPQPRNQR